MNIELIKVDDKPIHRRVFMKDQKYTGIERRRQPRPYTEKQFNRIAEVAVIVCFAGVLALMFSYMG